jgi:flagellin-specific chaperone FliS
MRKSTEPLEAVVNMVDSLRSAWSEVGAATKGSLHMEEVEA